MEMGKKVDNILYAAGSGLRNSVRFDMRLTEPVNGDALEQAAQTAARRFPYFAMRIERFGEEYRMVHNPLPFVVSGGGRAVTLGSAESNYHLIAFAYVDNSLYMDFSHFITDGQGCFPFLQTLVYTYLKLLHPKESFETDYLLQPDSDAADEADDYPYPEKPLTIEPVGSLERPESIFTLPDQPQGYDNMSGWTSFCMSIRQKDILGYMSSVTEVRRRFSLR